MNRTLTLLGCLTLLAGGVALQASADDPQSSPSPVKEPCCDAAAEAAKAASKVASEPKAKKDPKAEKSVQADATTVVPQICLQYLLYDDEEIALWSVNLYSDATCSTNMEAYYWTVSGRPAPQICSNGECEIEKGIGLRRAASGSLTPFPHIGRSLWRDSSYTHRPLPRVQDPKTSDYWDPRDGIKDSGELDSTFIKLMSAETSQPFAVRLSSGTAMFSSTSLGTKPADREINVGFEADMDEDDIEKLPSPTAVKEWNLYPSPTGRAFKTSVFVVTVDGVDYHVTTSRNNPVRVTP